jgi:hypothetical protein
VQEAINRFVTLDFLHKERQLSKKDAVALVAFVEHVVESCPENPSSPAFTPSLSPRRADAEKAFRRKAWEFLSQPRHARLLHRECADGLAACYISLSAHIPWKQLSRLAQKSEREPCSCVWCRVARHLTLLSLFLHWQADSLHGTQPPGCCC